MALDIVSLRGHMVPFTKHFECYLLLVPWFKNHLSSFELGFLNIFSRQKLVAYFVTRIVSVKALQIWREKMSTKPRSIRLLRWFDFRQSENRKNNRKTFEGASVEPTISSYSKSLCFKMERKHDNISSHA